MDKFKRLMAVTDFSKGAARAVNRAARLAAEHGAELELLHVVNRQPLQALLRLVPGLETRSEAEILAAARARLDQVAEGLAGQGARRVATHVCAGSPYAEIAARADAIAPDVVVIGAHGGGAVRGPLAGATAQKTARAVRVSVLVVRHEAKRPYASVLAPVDPSQDSHHALEMAARTAPGASLYVLHAYEPLFEDKAYFADASKEALAHYRKSIEEGARNHIDQLIAHSELGDTVTTRLIRRGQARRMIEEATHELGIDLIVMNARGHSELSRFFLGSVSLHVMLEAPADVLLVR